MARGGVVMVGGADDMVGGKHHMVNNEQHMVRVEHHMARRGVVLVNSDVDISRGDDLRC